MSGPSIGPFLSRLLSRSPNSRDVTTSRQSQPANIRRQHRHGRRRDAGHPQRMTKRVGTHLRKTLDNLTRQSGHAVEWKIARNPPPLVATRTLDLAVLPPQVTGVLHGRLDARNIARGARGAGAIDVKRPQPIRQHLFETRLRLTEQLARGHAITRRRPHERLVQCSQILRKALFTRSKFLPSLIVPH